MPCTEQVGCIVALSKIGVKTKPVDIAAVQMPAHVDGKREAAAPRHRPVPQENNKSAFRLGREERALGEWIE
jgi:hypothetical protein